MSGSILEAGEAVIVGVFLFFGGCAGVLLVVEGLKDSSFTFCHINLIYYSKDEHK